jgi:hypothetical protein
VHGPINVKSPNNTNKWQTGFNSAFKGLTFKNSVFCLDCSYVFYVVLRTAIISVYSINLGRLFFTTERDCVYSVVGNESLNITQINVRPLWLCPGSGRFFLECFNCPLSKFFISVPYSCSCYQRDKGAKPGNLSKISFGNKGASDRNVLHLVFVSKGNGQACTLFRDSTSKLTDSSIQSIDNI